MADLSPRPERTATSREERVAKEHRLANEDYASTAPLRHQNPRWPLYGAMADAVRDQLHATTEAPYDPLHAPGRTLPEPADLGTEIAITLRLLDETAGLNIHEDADMQKAAFSLNVRLRTLLAAIQAERGEGR